MIRLFFMFSFHISNIFLFTLGADMDPDDASCLYSLSRLFKEDFTQIITKITRKHFMFIRFTD